MLSSQEIPEIAEETEEVVDLDEEGEMADEEIHQDQKLITGLLLKIFQVVHLGR